MTFKILDMPTHQTSGAISSSTAWAITQPEESEERIVSSAILRRIAAGGVLVPALMLAHTQSLDEQFNQVPGEVWLSALDAEVQRLSLSPAATRVLGDHGTQRFQRFLRYANGWDSGRGKSLDSRSLATLNSFFAGVSRFGSSVSLFMTSEGYLQIAWDSANGPVELDFLPDELVAYMESEDRELVMPATGAGIRAMAVQLGIA
jgi:hypothetical protein